MEVWIVELIYLPIYLNRLSAILVLPGIPAERTTAGHAAFLCM